MIVWAIGECCYPPPSDAQPSMRALVERITPAFYKDYGQFGLSRIYVYLTPPMNPKAEESVASSPIAPQVSSLRPAAAASSRLFPVEHLVPFILVTVLFFLWGIPNNLHDVLIRSF